MSNVATQTTSTLTHPWWAPSRPADVLPPAVEVWVDRCAAVDLLDLIVDLASRRRAPGECDLLGVLALATRLLRVEGSRAAISSIEVEVVDDVLWWARRQQDIVDDAALGLDGVVGWWLGLRAG